MAQIGNPFMEQRTSALHEFSTAFMDRNYPSIPTGIVDRFVDFMGEENLRWFQHVKGLKGNYNAVLKLNYIKKRIPVHPIHLREGMQIRNWMRQQCEISSENFDYERGWLILLDLAISSEKYLQLGIARVAVATKFEYLNNKNMENTKTSNTMAEEKAKEVNAEELGSSRNSLQRVVENIYSVAALLERSNTKLRYETGCKELIDISINQSFDKIKKIHTYLKTEPETRTIGDMCMGISDMAGCLETMAAKTDERIQTSI
jgi:hypothetical protein